MPNILPRTNSRWPAPTISRGNSQTRWRRPGAHEAACPARGIWRQDRGSVDRLARHRKTVELGVVEIDKVVPDSDAAQRALCSSRMPCPPASTRPTRWSISAVRLMRSPLRVVMLPRRSDLKGLRLVQFWLIRVNGTLISGFEILVVPPRKA